MEVAFDAAMDLHVPIPIKLLLPGSPAARWSICCYIFENFARASFEIQAVVQMN